MAGLDPELHEAGGQVGCGQSVVGVVVSAADRAAGDEAVALELLDVVDLEATRRGQLLEGEAHPGGGGRERVGVRQRDHALLGGRGGLLATHVSEGSEVVVGFAR